MRWKTKVAVVNTGKIQCRLLRDRGLTANLDNAAMIWPLVTVKPSAAIEQSEVEMRRDGNAVPLHVQVIADEQDDRQQATPDT